MEDTLIFVDNGFFKLVKKYFEDEFENRQFLTLYLSNTFSNPVIHLMDYEYY